MNAQFPPPKPDNEPTAEEQTARLEATVRRLAALSDVAFAAAKKAEAKSAGIGATELEKLVRACRKQAEADKQEARARARPAEPWADNLILTESGRREGCEANIATILEHHPALTGGLWFDEFAIQPTWRKPPPWTLPGQRKGWQPRPVSDGDIAALTVWVQSECAVLATPAKCITAVCAVADRRRFHPVRDYLNSVTWDGTPRIEKWLHTYLHTPDDEYHTAVGSRWLIGAVARIFEPGCKLDTPLVLEGRQDLQKSTTAAILGGQWFTDNMPNLHSKDAMLQLQSKWILELSELVAVNRSENDQIKSFMSQQTDRFRPPYGKVAQDFPRQIAFIGTINPVGGYLRDPTGARRFWVVRCGGQDGTKSANTDDLRRDRDQIWAEAVQFYRDGKPHWLNTSELKALATDQQAERYEGDARDGLFTDWIAANARKNEKHGYYVTVLEVAAGALRLGDDVAKVDAKLQSIVRTYLVSRGWTMKQIGGRGDRTAYYVAPVGWKPSTTSPKAEPTVPPVPPMPERPAPWAGTAYVPPGAACDLDACAGTWKRQNDGRVTCSCPETGCFSAGQQLNPSA